MAHNAYMQARAGIEALLADPALADDEVRPLRTAQIRLTHDGLRGLARWALAEDFAPQRSGWLQRVHDMLDAVVPDWRGRVVWECEQGW